MSCCQGGFVGGGGSAPITLTPDRVVVTAPATGVLTVGPYWQSTGMGLFAAPTASFAFDIRVASGSTLQGGIFNTGAAGATWYVEAATTAASIAVRGGNAAFILTYSASATASPYSRWQTPSDNWMAGLHYDGAGFVGFKLSNGAGFGINDKIVINTNIGFFSDPVSTDDVYINRTRGIDPPVSLRVQNSSSAASSKSRLYLTSNSVSGYCYAHYANNSGSWYAGLEGLGTAYVIGLSAITNPANNWVTLAYLGLVKTATFLDATATSLYQFYVKSDASAISAARVHRFEFGGGANGQFQVINVGVGDSVLVLEASFSNPYIRFTSAALNVAAGVAAGSSFVMCEGTDLTGERFLAYDLTSDELTLYSDDNLYLNVDSSGSRSLLTLGNTEVAAGSAFSVVLVGEEAQIEWSQGGMVIGWDSGNTVHYINTNGTHLDLYASAFWFIGTASAAVAVYGESAFGASPPADPAGNGQWSFWFRDNGGVQTFEIRLRDSGGTLRTGSVTLT